MACVPGMPCYSDHIPANSWNRDFIGYPISANLVCYDGEALPETGVNPGDNLILALEKIDYALSPITLTQKFLNAISSNPSLKAEFCSTIANSCTTTTTSTSTTSTSTSTTTTTTTLPPPIIPYIYGSPELVFDFSDTGSYSNSGTAVADLSGNANNGVFSQGTGNGFPYTVTGYDSANGWLFLPGTSDQLSVRIPDVLKCSGTSPFTYIMYCQPTGYSYNGNDIAGLISNSYSPGGSNIGVKWVLFSPGNGSLIRLDDPGGQYIQSYPVGGGIGAWAMYVLTFDGLNLTQYQMVNGVTYSDANAYPFPATPLPSWGFFMGLSYNRWFKGNINYAAIYNTVLTQSELETIYAQLELRGY